jgi:hypothetical protein
MDGLPRTAASPRIRAAWPAKYWDGAEVWNGTQAPGDFDVLIFQKAYLTPQSQQIARRYDALKIADLCDPEHLETAKKLRLANHLDQMDACVVPTEALAEWFGKWLPTFVIPDRLDLEAHEVRGEDWEPYYPGQVGVCWLGGWQNYAALETMLPLLHTLGLPLVTISDRPYPNVPFVRWESVEQANAWIKRFDVVLNPQPPAGRFQYKSNNKSLTAWACGVPVAHDARELYELLDLSPAERFALGQEQRREVEALWDVRLSVREWQAVIEIVRAGVSGESLFT